jgi:hypothetical protein
MALIGCSTRHVGPGVESRFTNALVKPERVRPGVALIQVPSGAADVEGDDLGQTGRAGVLAG